MTNNTKAVFFDLYDTLIYIENKTNPYLKLLSELGMKEENKIKYAKNILLTKKFDSMQNFANYIKPEQRIETSKYEQEMLIELKSTKLYPETISVLEKLKEQKLDICLISNLATNYKKPFFDLGLNKYFTIKTFSCDVGYIKPEQEIYELTIQRLNQFTNIKMHEIMMIGNNLFTDVGIPKNLGLRGIHLNRINNQELKNKTETIFTLDEIFEHL